MEKMKSKSKGLIKATAVGFAVMLATAFFPAHAVAKAADYTGLDNVNNNTTRIEVGVEGQKSQSISVKKGQTVSIPTGVYYKNGTEHEIGGATQTAELSSNYKVYYKATNDEVTDLVGNQFVADRVGRYSIVYTVVDNGVEYSYELTVNCEASQANFEFETNSSNIIPSVYDIAYANGKDIILPLPKVVDEDGEEIISAENVEYYLLNKNKTNFTDSENKNAYVSLSISNAGQDVPITPVEEDGKVVGYKIAGDKLSVAALSGQEFKVYYSFYQVGSKEDVFVSSVSKSFTVKSNYFYTNSDKETAGYGLESSWSTSVSSLTAVVGVEKDLPKVTATTKSTNSPASESVEVYYDIKVTRDGNDVTEDVITEDGKFKADKEGTYKFVYTVKDFYGNEVDSSKTTFYIEKVKDSLSANVYMYDAGNANAFNAEDNKYVSAENLLKSQTVNRNIIMYAVGGTDNMVAKEEITLRREIRDNSSVKMFVVKEKAYNNYNLIFAPAVASGETSLDNIYKQVVADNYEIYKQMILAGKDVTSVSDIKEFLAGKYLFVTTEENKFNGETIVTKEGEVTAEDYINAGFAYVKPENAKNATFKDQTYSFYYYASDNINTEKSAYYTVKVAEGFSDAEVPTLTFSSDLQVAYLPTDSFEFDVATANDTTDTRIKAVTAYRFLNSKREAMASSQTTSKLNYVVKNTKDSVADKWYAGDSNGIVNETGWYIDETKSTYSIDLANRPYNDVDGYAQYVEILAYAIDDYGNGGFYNKIIKIADAEDTDMPELYKVVNAPEAGATYEAPQSITLPTLYFEDANVNYMHASVAVYKLTDNGKVRMQSSNMATEYDTLTDSFKVNAGSFHASTAGTYQVAITVSDSGNHNVTTYFNYTVKGGAVIEVPEINNISADTIELEAGQAHYLVPPTISMTESEEFGYIGLSEDDSNTATNYTTTVVSATGEYDLDQYYFTGNEKGLFKLQYKVYLMQYAKSALTAGSLKFDGDSLKFTYDSTEYFVYIDRENLGEEENPVVANTSKQGIGTALTGAGLTELKKVVTAYALESKVQTINVGGVQMEVTLDDNAYSDSYTGNVDPVEILKPTNISFNGSSYQTNNADSKVTITKTTGSTTTTLAEFSFEEWGDALDTDSINSDFEVKENGDVYLKLAGNGKYTIKYSIQAMDKSGLNVGAAKTMEYTFSYGDVIAPELEIKSSLAKAKYALNDTLNFSLAGSSISVSDIGTANVDKLLESMVVTLENTDLDEGEITLDPVDEDSYAYSHTFTSAGSYVLKITVTDEAGNKTTEKVNFEVTTEEKDSVNVNEVMGGVLIGLSVAVLAGVVIYFVVSKVRLDRKEKSYKNGNDKK